MIHRNPFGADIAQETDAVSGGNQHNESFGWNEGDWYPKWYGIRHPNNPEFYLDTDLAVGSNTVDASPLYTFANKEPFSDVGYGGSAVGADNGRFDWNDLDSDGQHDANETEHEPFEDLGLRPGSILHTNTQWGFGDGIYNMGNPGTEDVNGLLMRAVRWFTDIGHVDGYRLDAVKHVPSGFFGKQTAPKDDSNWGYCGQIQEQFNISRGFSDWDNHRDSCYGDQARRDDAVLYGEHLGSPPSGDGYVNAGMRMANDDLLNHVNHNIGSGLWSMDGAGFGTWGVGEAMMYVMSHDNNYLWGGDREAAHAYIVSRAGLPIVYTDGYNQSGGPDWFPKPAEIPFLGQFGSHYLPNTLDIRRHFGRGNQYGKWQDGDYIAWILKDETVTQPGPTIVFMMARNYGSAQTRDFNCEFPEGARLVNYSYHGGSFYVNVAGGGVLRDDSDQPIYVPSGGYFAFSWRNPEPPLVWDDGLAGEVQPITLLDDGEPVGTVQYERYDGRNGDADFNPLGVAGDTPGDYRYTMTIPRVTAGTNVTILARADGSAENILLKLDGGIDVNSHMGLGPVVGELRDNQPGVARDTFLGFEQMRYVTRLAEKFAAVSVSRNVIGSYGAETYEATIGTAGISVNEGSGPNTGDGTASWAYHEPTNINATVGLQFDPAPVSAADQAIALRLKIGYSGEPDKAWVYYTTDGTTYPEGSAGIGKGTTLVAEMHWIANGVDEGSGIPDWWEATLPAMAAGTTLRYKIGTYDSAAPSVFPWNSDNISVKRRMESQFVVTNLDTSAIAYYPHNDYSIMKRGLAEGFHILRTRCFLDRPNDPAIYREFTQTFYLDTERPSGEIIAPTNDGVILTGSTYTVITRTDPSVVDVWYRIVDTDSMNDDSETSADNGNGAWVRALESSVPDRAIVSDYPREWRFDYVGIPTNGSATLSVRLREISSSSDMGHSDTEGHFTTLTRTVTTGGNGLQLYVSQPGADGATVNYGDTFQANFSQSMVSGLSTTEAAAVFSIAIDGEPQPTNDYRFVSGISSNEHAIQYDLPNLYDGIAGQQLILRIDYDRTNQPALAAQRVVLAAVDDDSDNDGIPDEWEDRMGLDPEAGGDAGDDSDEDGFTSYEEYIANTDPLSSTQFFHVASMDTSTNSVGFSFQAQSNRHYFVWYTDALTTPGWQWQLATPASEPIEGTGSPYQFTEPAPPARRFYQVEVKTPE